MGKYKLTYFDIRARAEPIRLLFAVAGEDYEDHRVDFKTWPDVKDSESHYFIIIKLTMTRHCQNFTVR